MKPRDSKDVEFAARLVLEGFCSQELMQQVLTLQEGLIDKGKALTIAQICVKKKWLSRSEARFLLSGDEPPKDLVPGWVLEGQLGEGGMSRVFSARKPPSRNSVALKVLKPSQARKETQLQRFLLESKLLMAFEHENIVKAHELVQEDGLYALAMEKVVGRSLLEVIDDNGPLPEDASLYCILQIARGLTHMYGHRVVHRDIKPGNILITPSSTIKLCDLGLAVLVDQEGDAVEGMTVGTVEYISPEQALGSGTIDVRSDIYALGVTLYHMVVGEIPFKGDDDQETMAKRFVESLSSPKLAHVSPHMHYFIQKMMATDPDIRYQSPLELIADVEEQIRGSKSLSIVGSGNGLELDTSFESKEEKKGAAPVRKSRPGRPAPRRGGRRRR